ncbi:MAG: T9SS type A sorting domain-containing protein [Bacteroidetes bacterium]|nr:T9SS type A sorting domain-containing protein [Bacteroidota bacterium]
MKHHVSQILNRYSRMAGIFLLLHKEASSTVVVTDVDPDTVINLDGEFYLLDMDNNLINDFIIFKDSGVYYYEDYSSTSVRFREFIGAGPQATIQNKLLGGHYYNSWNGAEYYQPYDLSAGELISPEGQFYNAEVQVICAGHFINFYSAPAFDFGPGYWKDFDFEGVDDRYLGVSFVDEDNNRYYGWVRCSTADSMKAITIHEYAFENEPNKPILAGDTISYVDINTLPNTEAISIYSFENQIHIQLMNNQDATVNIYDIKGNKIFFEQINRNSEIINMDNFAAGIYVVSVKQGENVVTKKVIVE